MASDGAGSAQVAVPNVRDLRDPDGRPVPRVVEAAHGKIEHRNTSLLMLLSFHVGMCHRVRQTIAPTVVDGAHLNGRPRYDIAKANRRGS